MSRPRYEVGQIIRDWGGEFLSRFPVVEQVRKSFGRMSLCRTRWLGGHVEVCPECGEVHVSYNSCRDRHCPKCQNKERAVWVEMRKDEVLPSVKYFHTVFTVPHCLQQIAMSHQAVFYDAMFRAAWSTLRTFFANQGLQGGMTAILHTWGSNLYYHPHIHCIVTGGGVDRDGMWHHLKGCRKDGRHFLFPVQALSPMFRAKFLAMLTARLKETGEVIPQNVRGQCVKEPFVVYSRPPAKGVDQVLEYIGRYAYRVAISNSRILDYDAKEGKVTYDYKDYKHNGCHKTMSMSAVDFLHLLSLHILPPAFVRIRHYGLLSPSNRDKLRKVQKQLGGKPLPKERRKKTCADVCEQQGWEIGICPHCKCRMIVVETIAPARAPPLPAHARTASV
jgi:hypothetical protein